MDRIRTFFFYGADARRLTMCEKVLRNPGRLRPGSRAARTPRKRTQAGAGTLLRLMKYLEDAIKGVSSRASEALGESEETSCWHPAVPAVPEDAGRSIHDPIEQEKTSCRHGGGRNGGRLSAGRVSRWLLMSIARTCCVTYNLLPKVLCGMSPETGNLKNCLPPSANRAPGLTEFLRPPSN